MCNIQEVKRGGNENLIFNISPPSCYFSFLLIRKNITFKSNRKDTKICISDGIIESKNKWEVGIIIGPFINNNVIKFSNEWINNRGVQSKCMAAIQLSIKYNVKMQNLLE